MSGSVVVYVIEALYYYFIFLFKIIFATVHFLLFHYNLNFGTFEIASTQRNQKIQFKRFVRKFRSNQSGISLAKFKKSERALSDS